MRGLQVHYLSASPASLAEVLLTGGIPPNIDEPCSAESAYTRLFRWARPAQTLEVALPQMLAMPVREWCTSRDGGQASLKMWLSCSDPGLTHAQGGHGVAVPRRL